MRGKTGIWIILALLLMRPAAVVYAAPSDSAAAAVSGYCMGSELHAFIRLKEGYDVSKFRASLQSDEVLADREGTVARLTETDAIVRYVFMVDLTGSMRKYAEEVNLFVDSLMESEKRKAFFTVATFGEQFQVVSEDLTDRNAVKKVLGELQYREKLTDPYTGVESALTYLDGYSIKSGDLIHLVVITDGDPDLGMEDEAESLERERELAQSLEERIADTPEIIVSTLCTEQWDEYAYQALSTGRGIHEIIGDGQAASDAGARMAEYVDGLYRISFRLAEEPETERFDVELTLKERGAEGIILSLEGVPNLKLFSNADQEEQEENGLSGIGGHLRDPDKNSGNHTGTEAPEGNEGRKDTETPENNEERRNTEPTGHTEDRRDGEDPENAESAENRENADGQAGGDAQTEDDGPEHAGQGLKQLMPVAAAGALIFAGICAVIFAGKRRPVQTEKRQRPESGQTQGAGVGIAMKLEVYSGKCKRQSATFYLSEPIVIGSAPECDVVFADPEVSPRNSRIFIRDQTICIEDLNSAEGTALGGMRIQGKNRLRSGDVISIGDVEFCFKF